MQKYLSHPSLRRYLKHMEHVVREAVLAGSTGRLLKKLQPEKKVFAKPILFLYGPLLGLCRMNLKALTQTAQTNLFEELEKKFFRQRV